MKIRDVRRIGQLRLGFHVQTIKTYIKHKNKILKQCLLFLIFLIFKKRIFESFTQGYEMRSEPFFPFSADLSLFRTVRSVYSLSFLLLLKFDLILFLFDNNDFILFLFDSFEFIPILVANCDFNR